MQLNSLSQYIQSYFSPGRTGLYQLITLDILRSYEICAEHVFCLVGGSVVNCNILISVSLSSYVVVVG